MLPQSKHVINTIVPTSDLVRTRQLLPGMRRVPQPLQMNIFWLFGTRTPAFIPIRRASSTYLLERDLSLGKVSLARSSKNSILSRAIRRMLPFLHAKDTSPDSTPDVRLNQFVTFFSSSHPLLLSIMTLILVLADAALQRVPHEISSHPQVKYYAKRRGKPAEEVLLDRSFHHSAMKWLARTRSSICPEKMGRPDIVHNTLLQVLETPLNWMNQLRVLIHTQDGNLISINQRVRLPKNYLRFVGLIEQLFEQKKVPLKGEPLLTLERVTAKQMVNRMEPAKVIGLSRLGRPRLLRDVAEDMSNLTKPMVLIGAFPRGHFSRNTDRIIEETYSVDRTMLDAWVVAGRFVYDFEYAIGLAQKRVDQ